MKLGIYRGNNLKTSLLSTQTKEFLGEGGKKTKAAISLAHTLRIGK